MRGLLERADVRLLFGGQTLSMIGDWMMFIVLGIWAKTLTGSSSDAGLVFFVLTLTGVVAPLGGLVVDRLPKRPSTTAATSGSSTSSPRSTGSAATSSRPQGARC
jgi:MFS family permease